MALDRKRAKAHPARMSLPDAMRACYDGRTTQVVLAQRLGVAQNTISRWVNGAQRPSLEQVAAFERACDRPVGAVYRAMGLVEDPEPVTPEWAIQNDLNLDPSIASTLLEVLKAARVGQRPR